MISSRCRFVTGTSAVGTRYRLSRVTTYIWSSLSGIWPVPRALSSLTTTGGQTSVNPNSAVSVSMNHWMSPRSSAEPAPL